MLSEDKIKELLLEYMYSLPLPYFSPCVEVGSSEIEGRGLHALRDINEGEILVIERGPVVDGEFIKIIEEITGYHSNCCIGRNQYLLHAPINKKGSGGYINHSCCPNAGMLTDATWIAIHNIKQGTEIVCDYGTFETAKEWVMTCNCGSENCRNEITGRDFMLPNLKERLGSYFAPYLRRELHIT